MDKDRIAAIAAIAARGEQIKTNSAEYLWICRGIRPALPPSDKPPVVADRSSNPEQPQFRVRSPSGTTPVTRRRP
jgi:hypothetical protein